MNAPRAVAWVVEGTWEACVDAARALPEHWEITLLHVSDPEALEVATGARAGLLGRGGRPSAPDPELAALAERASSELLAAALQRLGRDATTKAREGRTEREVLDAATGADLLILARDGDPSRPGPRSVGHAARFVVDHAPLPVLLVWAQGAPHDAAPPPEPRHGPRHRHGPPPPPPR